MSELARLEEKRKALEKAEREYLEEWRRLRESYWKEREALDRKYGITPYRPFSLLPTLDEFFSSFDRIWEHVTAPFRALEKSFELAEKKDWEALHKALRELGFEKPHVEYQHGEGEFPQKRGYWRYRSMKITEKTESK